MNSSDADQTRTVSPRVDRPSDTAPTAWEDPAEWEYYEGLDEIEDDFELDLWEEDFRQGSAELDLCGGCGRPTGVTISLGEWVEHPVVCRHCLTEAD